MDKHITVNAFEEIVKNLDFDQNTLVICDIDDVIITPVDAVFSPRGEMLGIKEKCLKYLEKYIPIDFSKDSQFIYLLSIFLRDSCRRLVDPKFCDFLKFLKNENLDYLAMTGLEVGKLGVINDLVKWRVKDLLGLSVTFEEGIYPNLSNEGMFLRNHKGNITPFYFKNIIFTDRLSKGECLELWLKKIMKAYKKIIIIDDLLDNLTSIKKTCEFMEITCDTVLFKGAINFPVTVSIEEALLQMKILYFQKRWISDIEIKRRVF